MRVKRQSIPARLMINLNSVLPRLLVTVALVLALLKAAPAESKFSFATLTFPEEVETGRHKLDLEFEGKIGPQADGLYYDKYQTE
jgi:hypothetical protein